MSRYQSAIEALRMDGNAAQSAARVTADVAYKTSLTRLSLMDHAAAELLVMHEDGRINLHESAELRALVVTSLDNVGHEFDLGNEGRHLGPYNVWHGGPKSDCWTCQRVTALSTDVPEEARAGRCALRHADSAWEDIPHEPSACRE